MFVISLSFVQIWCHEKGYDHVDKLVLVRDGQLDLETGRQFLLWLGEAGVQQKVLKDEFGKDRSVSFETFDQATKWLKMTADYQLEGNVMNRLERGHVLTLPGIASMKSRLASTQRMSKFQECRETDQRSDLLLTFDQMRSMSRSVLDADRVSE